MPAKLVTPSSGKSTTVSWWWLQSRKKTWFWDILHLQGRALYAAEADRLRNWAEDRTRFSFTDAMEMYTENTWVSVFSLSVVCAFIILSSTGSNTFPGTWVRTHNYNLKESGIDVHIRSIIVVGSQLHALPEITGQLKGIRYSSPTAD